MRVSRLTTVVGAPAELSTYVVALVYVQVGVHVSLVRTPDRPRHRRPWLLERQHALHVVPLDLFPGVGVQDGRLHAEEWQRSAPRLGRRNASQRRDNVTAGLGLPVCVHDVCLLFTDLLVVPLPHLGRDRLAHGAQNSEFLHFVVDVLVAGSLEQSEGRRRDVKLGDLVLVDHVPVPGEVRVGGGALEDDGWHAEQQRRVHDVRVSGDPADIATAEEDVVVVDVERILGRGGRAQQVAGGRVHDAFGLARRSGRVQQEQRVFGHHRLGRRIGGVLLHLLGPPKVPALGPGHVGARSLVHDAAGDVGAPLERLVDNLLGANDLAASLALVGRDDDLGIGVDDAICQRAGREAGEDDRVACADPGHGQEGHDRLGDHRQVQGDGVALFDAVLLEDVRQAGNFTQELAVGDGPALAGLVGFVVDGWLVGVLECVSVDAVVGRVQLALQEPSGVSVLQRAGFDGLEITVPCKQLACHLTPELFWLFNGLLVQSLVLFEILQMGLA